MTRSSPPGAAPGCPRTTCAASGARPRADTDLGCVTPHTFRETVATLIDKEADTKSAAAQLGHASEDVADTYYIVKPVLAPDVSDILERLGTDRDGPEPSDRRSKRAA
jgi:integrase